jgi:hypothetical protein
LEVKIDTITLDTLVEKMIYEYPQSIEFGIMNGVRFMFCVGAYPTTLGDLLNEKNVADPQKFVEGLNTFLHSYEPNNKLPPT